MSRAWDLAIGDYDPLVGVVLAHQIGPGRPSRIGPDPVSIRRNPIRKDDTSRPLRSGAIARRPDLLSTIYINVPIQILADTDVEAEAELDALLAGWGPRTLPAWLYVNDPAGQKYAYRGKPRDAMQDETKVRSGLITAQMLFEATHPVRYSQTLNSFAQTIGTSGAGFGFPFGFPFGFGTGHPGEFTIHNAGSFETWPVLRIVPTTADPGPFRINDNARGLSFVYDAPVFFGQHLVVDMGEGIVFTGPSTAIVMDAPMDAIPAGGTLQSTNVARPASDWLSLPPGDTTFDCVVENGAASVQILWRDAWLR